MNNSTPSNWPYYFIDVNERTMLTCKKNRNNRYPNNHFQNPFLSRCPRLFAVVWIFSKVVFVPQLEKSKGNSYQSVKVHFPLFYPILSWEQGRQENPNMVKLANRCLHFINPLYLAVKNQAIYKIVFQNIEIYI